MPPRQELQRPQMASVLSPSHGHFLAPQQGAINKKPGRRAGQLDPDKIWARSSEPYKPQFNRLRRFRQCKKILRN